MEAPMKLYVDTNDELSSSILYGFTEKRKEDDIEYIRKDAFIEKAVQYLKVHKETVETEDNGIIGWIPDYFIDDFKKYMEGE